MTVQIMHYRSNYKYLIWNKEGTLNVKLLFLKAPSHFAYFMNRGLITNKNLSSNSIEKNNTLCFEINLNQEVINKSCWFFSFRKNFFLNNKTLERGLIYIGNIALVKNNEPWIILTLIYISINIYENLFFLFHKFQSFLSN